MLQPSLRWTGDWRSGAHQAERSLTGYLGLGAAEEVVPLLHRHGYESSFRRAFPDDPKPIGPGNYAMALQSYQATLVTPAAFDRYLLGSLTGGIPAHYGPPVGGESAPDPSALPDRDLK